jgi:glycerol-3-phosphate dehydrogenase
LAEPPGEHLYGSEAPALRQLPGAANWLWRDEAAAAGTSAGLSEAMVRFAARHEMARTVADVLARRSRLLFLDAAAAEAAAPAVSRILAEELGRDTPTEDFVALARQYRTVP